MSVGDVKVVEQRSPIRVVVEDGVREPHQRADVLGDDRATPRIRGSQPVGPHSQPVGGDVTVEESIRVGAPVVAAPTVGMKGSDALSVGESGDAKLQMGLTVHDDLLIDPGIGTAPKPGAGPSSG